jgi:cysteine desulfuration protein SufE
MGVPPALQRIVDMFAAAPNDLRLEALLDYSRRLPPLPPGMVADGMEQVVECATAFFLATDVDENGRVRLWFDSPKESPTVRGYAAILAEGLDGATVDEVTDLPADFYMAMGLQNVLTPQRLRGMDAIVARLKRQVREHAAA